MNTRPHHGIRLLVSLFSLLAVSDPLSAQSPSPATDDFSKKPTDEVIELSPFVVNAEQDTGYQATSTLAGTRLNTPVTDLGASISIYTKDFLNDIGATSANELLVYATSMEAAGANGNFSGATSDINAVQINGDEVRAKPQNANRTRGLGAPNLTRGFFNTDIASDSYNVESMTVNRGPNAILFGVGSPAGVVESTLLQPILSRNKNKIQFRIGDNSSLRNTFDFNRVLIKNKLALRIAAVKDDERFNQRPAFENKERIYGALTYEPTRSTALRMNFESGHTTANRPITVLPFNSISSYWEAAGRPGYDWTYYDDPARNPDAATQVAGAGTEGNLIMQRVIFGYLVPVFSDPAGTSPDFIFKGNLATTNGNAANAVKSQLFNALVNRDKANDSVRFVTTANISELLGNFWTADNVPPGQLPGIAPAGIKNQGFTDYSAFDFRNHLIDEVSRQGDNFHAFNLAFEQRAWGDRIGIELAYDRQQFNQYSNNSAFSTNNGNHVRIDVNQVLPNGQTNPNYGRPYTVGNLEPSWRRTHSDRETKRATAYLKYDFSDLKLPWGKWLGRHSLTGLYEENTAEDVSYRYRLAVDGPAAQAINANIGAYSRRVASAIYLGPSIIGNNNPLQLQAIRVPLLQAGTLPVPVSIFTRAGNATDPGAFADYPVSLVEINDNGNAQRDVVKSQAFVLQSYWLQENLVTLVGWRRDEDYFAREAIKAGKGATSSNDPGQVQYNFDDFHFPSTPPLNVASEIMTYSAVLHWPQKLVELPNGSELSAFYNQSSNFTPSGGRVNGFNETLASPSGETKEYGINISFLNNKFSLRVNHFETKVQGQSVRPSVYTTAINNGVLQVADNWAIEGNDNPQLVAMRNADIETLFSPLPADFRSIYNWGVTGSVPNLSPNGRQTPAGSTDTTDFTATGTEFEIVYNPTRNWRIMANVAKQETIQSNSLPFLKRFIGLMTPVWTQLRDRARVSYPLGWQPGDSMAGVQTLGDWLDTNVFVPFATELATEGSASPEQRKWRANLVTNYTFGRDSIFGDRLKGWGIGGTVRWQDKLGIGYPTTRNGDSSVTLDIAHPYYAPAETNVDAWISYERMIWKKRIKWRAQLNVRNILGGSDPIAISAQPWGDVAISRIPPERRFYLTNTFSF